MNSERTTERVRAARRRADEVVVVEDLTPEEIQALEDEKRVLIAHLEAQAEQHEDRVYEQRATAVIDAMLGIPTGPTDEPDEDGVAAVEAVADAVDAQDDVTVGVVTGLQERAATVRAAQEQSDVDRLTAVKDRLRLVYEKARDAHRAVLKLRAQHSKTLATLEHLDWKWVRESLSGTVYMPRVLAAQHALDTVLTMFRSLDRMWEITRDGWRDLSLARLSGLPDLEYLMKHLGECEYSARQDFFKLRDAVQKLDAAMKAADGDRVPISADAAATAATAADTRDRMRPGLDPLPAKPDESRLAPTRVRDKNPFDV